MLNKLTITSSLIGLALIVFTPMPIGPYHIALLITMIVYYLLSNKRVISTTNKVVLITGCDSGLGFSLALHVHGLGFTVIAGCLRSDGLGAKKLGELCSGRMHVVELDVTNTSSIKTTVEKVKTMLSENPLLEFSTLVNNAGVMIFGEFEWLTEDHIFNQVNINLLGTMRVTKHFCSLLRKYKGRIITVSSHCALATLPGLAVYGATKAAVSAWSDGLRIEQDKYGVKVITIVPGSFVQQSNIMARQREYAREMEEEMDNGDLEFFGDYFERCNQHLSGVQPPTETVPAEPRPIKDDGVYSVFESAILSEDPNPYYEHGPLRYEIYHFMFKITPTWLRDRLVERFISLPNWGNGS